MDNKPVSMVQYTTEQKLNYFTNKLHDVAHNMLEAENAYEAIYWVRQASIIAKRIERLAALSESGVPSHVKK